MEFINQTDFDTIGRYAGQDVTEKAHNELVAVYDKLDALCKKIAERGYKYDIRKDPRKQGGRGKFVFQDYHWAKIYPTDFYDSCKDKFAYIVGFNDVLHFHMMGIKDYQDKPASNEASKLAWTEIDIDDTEADYDTVTDEFIAFDEKNRNLFIKTAAELGIDYCKTLLKGKKMEELISLLEYKKQVILQGPPGTGKTYNAKNIAYQLIFDETISEDSSIRKTQLKKLEDSEQLKLIQFHPSYSYEDFVRGITAKANSDGNIEYKTENKVLAEFAKEANKNFSDYQKDADVVSYEKWIKQKFEDYILSLESRIDNGTVNLNNTDAYITPIKQGEKEFHYSVQSFKVFYIISFEDFFKFYNEARKTDDIIKSPLFFPDQHKYSLAQLIYDFRNFVGKEPEFKDTIKENLKKYILVIDEINRANLSSVLGELIYGLEYRDEPVDSMYEFEGSKKIVLPPNLYIIGTMNTADRSVGHIDYAIRRRFAFKDVLPSKEPIKEFARPLFKTVSELFVKEFDQIAWSNPKPLRSDFIASDFRPEDVWIGHSYFMTKKNEVEGLKELQLKLEYEILPILKEYLKDGILLDSANEIIKKLNVEIPTK